MDNYDFDTAEMLRKLVGEQKTSFVVPNEVLAEEVTNDQEKPKNLLCDDIPEGYIHYEKILLFNLLILKLIYNAIRIQIPAL